MYNSKLTINSFDFYEAEFNNASNSFGSNANFWQNSYIFPNLYQKQKL